jgi:diguanylate cyclase (GGDEF)-like protein
MPLKLDSDLAGFLAGGRATPFTLEERDIFQIILLQATAALKNLALFEQMKFQANRDPLTGLYNQRYFWEVLRDEVNRGQRYQIPLSLLFLDLDHFKEVNDTYGHAVGDEVLQAVSRLIETSIRQSDQLFRYGGEEFAIICPQSSQAQAYHLAERLRSRLAEEPLKLSDRSLPVTMSIGVASLMGAMTATEILQRAGAALYRAKQEGRNRVEVAAS